MAFPIRAYARALYEAAYGQSKAEIGALVERVLELMKEKGAIGKAAELAKEIERLDDRSEGIVRATVTSAHALDNATLEQLTKKIKSRGHAKEVVWEKKINKELLGGAVIRYGDKVIDLSVAASVERLAEAIKQ